MCAAGTVSFHLPASEESREQRSRLAWRVVFDSLHRSAADSGEEWCDACIEMLKRAGKISNTKVGKKSRAAWDPFSRTIPAALDTSLSFLERYGEPVACSASRLLSSLDTLALTLPLLLASIQLSRQLCSLSLSLALSLMLGLSASLRHSLTLDSDSRGGYLQSICVCFEGTRVPP